jgi:cytochrome c-type biogenesis protein CcmH
MTARHALKVLLSVIPAQAGIQRSSNPLDFSSRSLSTRLGGMATLASVAVYLLLTVNSPLHAATAPDLEERTRALASELRCVVCQNLSVADSPSEMARQMRAIVHEQLAAGKTPDEIKDFFVSKYGQWVLLKPETSGFSLLLWLLPYVALTLGVIIALLVMRRWVKRRAPPMPAVNAVKDMERLRSEFLQDHVEQPDSDDTSPRAELLRERARLRGELDELEFDFQSGKYSEVDFLSFRSEIENKAAAVMEKLDALPPQAAAKTANEKKPGREPGKQVDDIHRRLRRWQIAAGGAFLLLFGLVLGILLTQALRPRTSQQDSITGGFLTGTGDGETAALLQEGKQAFERQEFAKAIEAFKKVLARDPNQAEAHTYMGLILVQAGHGDGALMAFEKALAIAPNYPMALWGKGMVLYQDKKDYPAARVVLEKLLQLIPPGDEHNEIAKVLAEMPASGTSSPAPVTASAKPTASGQTISGKISVDAKLKSKIDGEASLFIIVRQAGGTGGPPLAVKKIDKPSFPLSYAIGSENVMMKGLPFTGKVVITARLDKDGNAITREAGNLLGDYKKNPADVGSQNVDITLDQLAQ